MSADGGAVYFEAREGKYTATAVNINKSLIALIKYRWEQVGATHSWRIRLDDCKADQEMS